MSVEDSFRMSDLDKDGNVVVFDIVESEDGGTYWGYGHVEPEKFIAEVNRWIVHTMGEEERIYSDPEELAKAGAHVKHLWAACSSDKDELFTVPAAENLTPGPDTFPVTRLWL